jgi:hypothetical protein
MLNKKLIVVALLVLSFGQGVYASAPLVSRLKISANHRYFTTATGKPFFWLGDTGWLLFSKLNQEDAEIYLEDRRKKGFNVIQVMVLHSVGAVNIYGDTALAHRNVSKPKVTHGSSFANKEEYDFWDHVDYIVDLAAKKGIYIAMVPVWGGNVKAKLVNDKDAAVYAKFLAQRYKSRANIIWMNGGDIKGSDFTDVWNAIGSTLHQYDPGRLITYHPFGRTQSSTWFHNKKWLSFNTFQSGHRDYAQDTSLKDHKYGEDSWKYVTVDYNLKPVKPVLDAEPSYEDIPHGLHDTLQPRWTADDLRRYAYWSVFAGACGFTYGNNAVMQMRKADEKGGAYGAKVSWQQAIEHPGASQMKFLKQLMLSRRYFERVPNQSLIAGQQGEKYDRLIATGGKRYAFVYTYNARNMEINTTGLQGSKIKASWYNPRNGEYTPIGNFAKKKLLSFIPPGEKKLGNDWVLVLDAI